MTDYEAAVLALLARIATALENLSEDFDIANGLGPMTYVNYPPNEADQ